MSSAGKKGVKDARFDLLPWDAIWAVSKVFGWGARKYAERNWERGLNWSASKAALDRHLALWWAKQETDEESGMSHLAHVAWHALVLLAFALRGAGTDDRPDTHSLSSMDAEVTNPEDIEAAKEEAISGLGFFA